MLPYCYRHHGDDGGGDGDAPLAIGFVVAIYKHNYCSPNLQHIGIIQIAVSFNAKS